jgi:hypothetical protein
LGKVLYGLHIDIIIHNHHKWPRPLLHNNFQAPNTASLDNFILILPFILT